MNLNNLTITIDDKSLIYDISLSLAPGSIHALMGPNGSGKSSLAHAIVGDPRYTIASGNMLLDGHDITHYSPVDRSKVGIFLAFQQPYTLSGVSTYAFLKEIYRARGLFTTLEEFDALVHDLFFRVKLSTSYLQRSVNDGFSGGEKKRLEIVQLMLLKPKVAILDEIDSGLDIDALAVVAQALERARSDNPDMRIILITHYARILSYITPDVVHILKKGNIVVSGDYNLALELDSKGYDAF